MNPMNQPAPFAGFFRTDNGQHCSIDAALRLGLVQPHEDADQMHTRSQGRIPYAAALSMGLIDKEAEAIVRAHPNVKRTPRGTISQPPAAPRGPLGELEGTLTGAVALALRQYVTTRSDEDLATFAGALRAALENAG